VYLNEMLGWFSARTCAETAAWSKIIVDKATGRVLGAHFVGHEGQELINVFASRRSGGATPAMPGRRRIS
jgi:glutathione reductase (NADPH)